MAVILPDAPGVVRIVHQGQNQGLPWVNTFHVLGSLGLYTQTDMEAVALAMHNAYFNSFVPQLNTATQLLSTTAIDLTSRTGPVGIETVSHAGTIPASSLPGLQVAYCISWTIQDRYRGGHPRMYLCAASNTEFQNGRTLTPTKVTALEAAADGYLVAAENMTVAGQTWSPVCVRYWSHNQLLATPLIRPIRGRAVHNRIDTMRRRLGKEAS